MHFCMFIALNKVSMICESGIIHKKFMEKIKSILFKNLRATSF